MTKIALVLSGCGQHDGSETHETIATLLALDKAAVEWQAFAPNIAQRDVINHLTSSSSKDSRNALQEAARLVRGNIADIANARPEDYAGCIVPGGAGAIKTLSNFLENDVDFTIEPQTKKFLEHFVNSKKPIGFICIAPVMIAKLYSEPTKVTIGNDKELAEKLETIGMLHQDCAATDIVVDDNNKVVSTPANMVANENISQVFTGIDKLVRKVIELSS